MDVRMDKIAVRFGAVEALRGVSLGMTPGTTTVLVGPNGAGKSTLLSVLLGLIRPDRGRVLVNGEEVANPRRGTSREFRARLGYLPDAAAFSENLTGRQVLRFFAYARGVARSRVEEVLDRIGLADAAHRRVRGYSRGMRQRLGLGVAILGSPDVLVLDEPTGGLDQEGLAVLWQVLAEWHEAGRTVLMSTHEVATVERRADAVCVLLDGRVQAIGTPDELRRHAGLPVVVRAETSGQADATRLAAVLDGPDVAGNAVEVTVTPDALVGVMRDMSASGAELTRLRIEEPGLDEVYRHILGGASWDASRVH